MVGGADRIVDRRGKRAGFCATADWPDLERQGVVVATTQLLEKCIQVRRTKGHGAQSTNNSTLLAPLQPESSQRPLMPCPVATSTFPPLLSEGQVAAARGASSLAGYDGDLRTLPITSEDERIFVLPQDDVVALRDVRTLEQVLQQVLGRKVWILASIDEATVPFV